MMDIDYGKIIEFCGLMLLGLSVWAAIIVIGAHFVVAFITAICAHPTFVLSALCMIALSSLIAYIAGSRGWR